MSASASTTVHFFTWALKSIYVEYHMRSLRLVMRCTMCIVLYNVYCFPYFSPNALKNNEEREFERNRERFLFLKVIFISFAYQPICSLAIFVYYLCCH